MEPRVQLHNARVYDTVTVITDIIYSRRVNRSPNEVRIFTRFQGDTQKWNVILAIKIALGVTSKH